MPRRTRVLAAVLATLAGTLGARQWAAGRPREPRLVFKNFGDHDVPNLTIETASRTARLGRVRPGRTVPLPLRPEAGKVYLIQGNEAEGDALIRLLDIGRRERRDILIGVDDHNCLYVEGGLTLHHDWGPDPRNHHYP